MSEYLSQLRKDKGVYAGMAELLWNSRYEESDRRIEFMAILQNTHMYMDTMEETKG